MFTVASIWGTVALQLADQEILPFNYVSYADELQVCYRLRNYITSRQIFKEIR